MGPPPGSPDGRYRPHSAVVGSRRQDRRRCDLDVKRYAVLLTAAPEITRADKRRLRGFVLRLTMIAASVRFAVMGWS